MRLSLIVLVILPAFCSGQAGDARRYSKGTVMFPNAGICFAKQTELIKFIEANGGVAAPFNRGGDFLNISYLTDSDLLIGLSFGGLYPGTDNPTLRLSYASIHFGKPVYSNNFLQANINGDLYFLGYTIPGIIPANMPLPPSNTFYMKGSTFGGGLSLQLMVNVKQCKEASIQVGLEYGVTFINPAPYWSFGYDYLDQRGYTRYKGTHISGPDVDSMISYARVSFIIKFE
jgi:hypothetical protein